MTNDAIQRIHARQVLDSRGHPTVEVEVYCQGGAMGRAIVPSGASTGRHEAVELRDGDPKHFGGKGVRKAVAHVRDLIAPALNDMRASQQRDIDQKMLSLDGTPNKSRLGANAILGVSLACAQAAAAARSIPLWQYLDPGSQSTMPLPMVNLISGGLHAGKNIEFQDFLLLPIGARSYSEALEMTVDVYRSLAKVLREAGHESVLVGDEGGFGPKLASNQEALDLIVLSFDRLGLKSGIDAAIALDVASTHFFDQGQYRLAGKTLSSSDLADTLAKWTEQYPILSIEDGMAEDDWAGWKQLTERLANIVQLIGDDLFVTNATRLKQGIDRGVANSILIKVNQIGTLTETFDVMTQAKAAGYRPVVSARSGETEDPFLADLAVASGAGQIKIGSIVRSERLAKYNQLLRIEEELPRFAGWKKV